MAGQITDLLVSEQDIRDAYQLHYSRYPLRKFMILIVAASVIGLIAAKLSGANDIGQALAVLGGILLWAIFILLVIIGLNRFILIPRIARKVHTQQADFHHPLTYQWDDESIEVQQIHGRWRRIWSEYVGWRRNDKTLLLYQSDMLFNLIPINATTQNAIAEIEQQLIAHNIPKK